MLRRKKFAVLLGISCLASFLAGFSVNLQFTLSRTSSLPRAWKANRLAEGTQLVSEPSHADPQQSDYVEPVNRTWMPVNNFDGPGIYRACVPRPRGNNKAVHKVVTGGLVETSTVMTPNYCLQRCGHFKFTYAVLGRGTDCFCSNVTGKSPLILTYVDGFHCDVPCSGEPKYNCGGDQFMSLYRTSVPDERCSVVKLQPKRTFPMMALASFPRSGNTWTRQLIMLGTGYMTSTVYRGEIMALPKSIFNGNNSEIMYTMGETICSKTHHYHVRHVLQFKGAVLIIRNPYSAVVADMFRRKMDWRKIVDDFSTMTDTKGWNKFVEYQSEVWRNLTMNWITNTRRIHVTHYESLEADPVVEITKIVRFLNVPVDKERILCATQEFPSSKATGVKLGAYGKETRKYLTIDLFTKRMRSVIDGYIKEVNATLKEYQLSPIPRDYSVTTF